MIKKILPLLTLLGLLAVTASAQQYQATTILNGGTNNVAAATTNSSVAQIIGLTRFDSAVFEVNFKLTGAGTSAVVYKIDESADGTNWVTNTRSLSVTANGGTTVVGLTNFTVNSVGYLRWNVIEQPNANALTNHVVRVWTKPRRNG